MIHSPVFTVRSELKALPDNFQICTLSASDLNFMFPVGIIETPVDIVVDGVILRKDMIDFYNPFVWTTNSRLQLPPDSTVTVMIHPVFEEIVNKKISIRYQNLLINYPSYLGTFTRIGPTFSDLFERVHISVTEYDDDTELEVEDDSEDIE